MHWTRRDYRVESHILCHHDTAKYSVRRLFLYAYACSCSRCLPHIVPDGSRPDAFVARPSIIIMMQEAAVFVPSCTMANLLSVGAWCARGEGVIVGNESHIFHYEQGGVSWLMGAVMHTVPNQEDGTLKLRGKGSVLEAIESRHGGTDPHYYKQGLVAIENTQNRCGGAVLGSAYIDDLSQLCAQHGLPLHMDGARLMNAVAASGETAARVSKSVDSVSLCLSKGLGAPIGALVIGSSEFCAKVRRLRKAVGGGMRQAGVIASAGIVGLKEQTPRLATDHARAKSLARGLAAIPGIVVDPSKVPTNIVYFDLDPSRLSSEHLVSKMNAGMTHADPVQPSSQPASASAPQPVLLTDVVASCTKPTTSASAPATSASSSSASTPATADLFAALVQRLAGCKMGSYGGHRLRAVTHHQVNDADVERLLQGAALAGKLLSKQ